MTLIYSRKAYQEDKKFAKIVEGTSMEANSLKEHMQLIQEEYKDFVIIQLWTFEHGGMSIDTFQRCPWDSSADAFGAYTKNAYTELLDRLEKINEDL